jgi:hypothetical protein
MTAADVHNWPAKQLLRLVFGGELKSLDDVGSRPRRARLRRHVSEHAGGLQSLEGMAQHTVDNAQMRYFIVHLHASRSQRHGAATFVRLWPSTRPDGSVAPLHPS